MAGNTIFFKQKHTSVSKPHVSVLNQKHLEYIATRKGAMNNPECGFGLWGRLPGERLSQNINDLQGAKKVISEISRPNGNKSAKTVYRVILSVDNDMAVKHGLYEREPWQSLVDENIDVIAKEMYIRDENFCWMASMHYKRGHPHVHIVYWDNGNQPRNEIVPKKRFEIMTTRIKAQFNRALERKAIHKLQVEQKEELTDLRSLLGESIQETQVLNLDRVTNLKLDELGRDVLELYQKRPTDGSFRYQTLPDDYKAQVDALIDKMLQIPQFATQVRRYEGLTQEISEMYGNGQSEQEHQLENARKKMRNALGNEIMNAIRDCVRGQEQREVPTLSAFEVKVAVTIRELLEGNPLYSEYLEMLPKWRTPWKALQKDERFAELEKKLIAEVTSDKRLKSAVKAYARNFTSKEQKELMGEQWKRLKEKDLSSEEREEIKITLKQLRAETGESAAYKALFSVTYKILHETAAEEKGYLQQMGGSMLIQALLRGFSGVGGQRGSAQQKRDRLRANGKSLSASAKKDRKQQLSQAGAWEQEI